MDGALEMLQVGCDKASDLEPDFVYWVASTEAVAVDAAERVTAKIKELPGSEKKRLQKVARAVVEKKLMPVLADIPECMKDALDGVVRSWLKQHLYEVLDELMLAEEAVSALCSALPEGLREALDTEELREGMVEMYRKKGVHSAKLISEHVDKQFEAFIRGARPSLQDVFRENKEKWVISEAPATVTKYFLSQEWLIEPLVRPEEARNVEAASKAWQLFSKYHESGLAAAVVTFNAAMEERCIQVMAALPPWMDLPTRAKCRVNYLQEEYFIQMMKAMSAADSAPGQNVGKKRAAESGPDAEDVASWKKMKQGDMEAVVSENCGTKIVAHAASGSAVVEPALHKEEKFASAVGAPKICVAMSPKKGRHSVTVPDGDATEYVTIAEILDSSMRECASVISSKVQVHVIGYTRSEKVLMLTGMDATMMVQVYVGEKNMDRVLELLPEEDEMDMEQTVALEIAYGKARCSDGQPMTQTRLEVQKDTLVTLVKREEYSEVFLKPRQFASKYFVTEFGTLVGVAMPQLVTLQGVVYKFGTTGITGKDKTVQSVYLQDRRGDLLKIVFHDTWAEGQHLKTGNFLQVYFAKLLSGRGERSKEGTLWVYPDAHVCVVEKARALMTLVKEIKLSAE